jgi:hypothetical protein
MTTATYADEFKSSPRYKAILAVFAAVDALPEDKPVNEVLKLMNETSRNCNGIERDRLPDLVRKALADRGRRF